MRCPNSVRTVLRKQALAWMQRGWGVLCHSLRSLGPHDNGGQKGVNGWGSQSFSVNTGLNCAPNMEWTLCLSHELLTRCAARYITAPSNLSSLPHQRLISSSSTQTRSALPPSSWRTDARKLTKTLAAVARIHNRQLLISHLWCFTNTSWIIQHILICLMVSSSLRVPGCYSPHPIPYFSLFIFCPLSSSIPFCCGLLLLNGCSESWF